MSASPIDVALIVTRALDACGVRYSIGGSIASSLTGEPRATLDADILVDLPAARVAQFIDALGPEFFGDPDALRRAIREHSTVNIFHRVSSTKIDLFVAGDSVLERSQLARRVRVRIGETADVFAHSPEDILLQKLLRYREDGGVSDRHWRDVLGILLAQGDRIDTAYLEETAREAELADLLHRAMAEAAR